MLHVASKRPNNTKIIRTVQPNASDVSFIMQPPQPPAGAAGFDPEAYMQQMSNMTMIIAQQQQMLNAMAAQQQQQFGGGGHFPPQHQQFHHNTAHYHEASNTPSTASSSVLPKSRKFPAPATPATTEFTSIVQNEPLPKSKKFSKPAESNAATTIATANVDTQQKDGDSVLAKSSSTAAVIAGEEQQNTQHHPFHNGYIRGGRTGGRYGRGAPAEGFVRGGRGRGGRFQQQFPPSYHPAAMLSPFAVNPTLAPPGTTTETPFMMHATPNMMGGGFRAPAAGIRGGRFSGRGAGGRFPVSRTAAGRGVIANKKWVRDTGPTTAAPGDSTTTTSVTDQDVSNNNTAST